MKKLVVGILAHVDAGKTTLAESLLYLTGSIRKLGRVDHKDAFLDTYDLERARGITIFSKQAVFTHREQEITLLDTPGHVDFSAEMERTLQVLDYAVLVISGSDGVQGHTETLWRLLNRYGIPTFLFINKMDMEGTDRKALLEELRRKLSDACVDFSDDQGEEFLENLAVCDEALLEQYMEHQTIDRKDIIGLIAGRKVFPCYFGSALKVEGVERLLDGLAGYTESMSYPEQFGAKVFKIARDDQGKRLTFLKVTGGSIRVKMPLTNRKTPGNQEEDADWEEKVDQIRIYSGSKYEAVPEAGAGTICAVTGLNRTYPGEGLGIEAVSDMPSLEPVLNYQLILPPDCDVPPMLSSLRQLEEEDPLLHIVWSETLREIHVQLMGEIQLEILRSLILERFGVNVEFGTGNIVYKETILEPVVGVGHFEPLRHYAEVHLLLEPGEEGSGLQFFSNCSEDVLGRNWQHLILTHLEERQHIGVLTGSPITDLRITLLNGRAHLKHTEGGDFRQATYRAVRQGLMKAKSILLEPYYKYTLEVPSESIGRAMSDIQRMSGEFDPPEINEDVAVLTGTAPVASMQGYLAEVNAYTRGRGRLFCTLKGYAPCHNPEEVISAIGYDCDSDLDNPSGSVFCANGAGFVVEWDKVEDYMHVDSGWKPPGTEEVTEETKDGIQNATKYGINYYGIQDEIKNDLKHGTMRGMQDAAKRGAVKSGNKGRDNDPWKMDKELEDIFVRTFGPIKQRINTSQGSLGYEKPDPYEKADYQRSSREQEPVKDYLLVDGYNIIFAWDELNELAKMNLDGARNKLMDILCNYQGFKKCILILVFDAYKVKGGVGGIQDYHNIHVVYTKEAETADQYIEKVTHEIAKKHRVTVATSDALEQLIIMGQGAARLSAKDLKEEVLRVMNQIRRDYLEKQPSGRAYLKEQFSDNILELLEDRKDGQE
ncbi:MAG TPA: GTP-binding protein [Clostridiales bacterium]|nr:GTP-binding protein [Clostridiales bacterium]